MSDNYLDDEELITPKEVSEFKPSHENKSNAKFILASK